MAGPRDRLGEVLALLVFTDTFGYAIVLPLMPLAAQRRGASPLAVGALFATYSGCQLLFAPLLGRLSDRFGRRPVLLASLIGSAAGFALMLLGGYLPLLVSRVVDGVTAGNIAIVNAVVLDRFPRSDWGARFTYLSTATGLGILVGIGVSAGLARFGLSAAAMVALALCLASAGFMWRFLPESATKGPAAQPWTARQAVTLQRAVPAGLIATVLQAAFLLTLPLYLNRILGWDQVKSTLALAALIAVAAVSQLTVVSPLMRRLDPRSVALSGFAFLLLGGLVLVSNHAAAGVVAGAVAAIIGVAFLSPAVPTLISHHNRSLQEGAVMGMNQSVASAGQMAGPLLGYGALQLFAAPGYGAICAVLAAGGIALTYPIRRGASDE
jgi:DHA1 family tetracycline resistance protein-like MFS transporter